MNELTRDKNLNDMPPAGFNRQITPDGQQDVTATDLLSEAVANMVDGLTPEEERPSPKE